MVRQIFFFIQRLFASWKSEGAETNLETVPPKFEAGTNDQDLWADVHVVQVFLRGYVRENKGVVIGSILRPLAPRHHRCAADQSRVQEK